LTIETASVVPLDDLRAVVMSRTIDVEVFAAVYVDNKVFISAGVFDVPMRITLRRVVPQDYFGSIVSGFRHNIQIFAARVPVLDNVGTTGSSEFGASDWADDPLRMAAARIVPLVNFGAIVA